MSKVNTCYLIGIGTHAPKSYPQDELLGLCEANRSEFAIAVNKTAAIDTRSFCKNPADFLHADFEARTQYHQEASVHMGYEALTKAVGSLSLSKIDAVIGVTSTGFLQPGLAQLLGSKHGVGHLFAQRFNLVGDGCYGAIPGLQLAHSLIESGQCATVALVCSEANLALLDTQSQDPSLVLPRVLFGEGAAALIFSNQPLDGTLSPRLLATGNMMIPETSDKVGIRLGNSWTCKIAREVPLIGEKAIPEMVNQFLSKQGLAPAHIKHWAFHAGGRKVLEALQGGFSLSDSQMFPSADVLRKYGNISSVSALFSVQFLLDVQTPEPGEFGLIVAIGPGMITGAALLEW